MQPNALEIRGARKIYTGFALRDVNLTVPAGHVMGLIGPNGAGKTTLMNTISGIVPARSGEIIFDDRALEVAPNGCFVECSAFGFFGA